MCTCTLRRRSRAYALGAVFQIYGTFGLGRRVHRATADAMSSFEVESFEELTFECVAGAISNMRRIRHHNDQLD